MNRMDGPVAAIDIGSNSVRLLISGPDLQDIHRESNVTGLARGVDAGGELSDAAVGETLAVLRRYAAAIDGADVRAMAAVATSASRDAANGIEVMERFADVLGREPSIIDGTKEAELAFSGAVAHLPGAGRRIIIDIGGGSTEIILGEAEASWAHSYDVGSVRLTDRHLRTKPSTASAVAAAAADARSILSEPRPPGAAGAEVVGVAGSFANLATIQLGLAQYDSAAVQGSTLTREHVSELIELFTPLDLDQLRQIRGMHPGRVPVILGGAIVAAASMDAVGASELTVSAHGLLDGLVRELIEAG